MCMLNLESIDANGVPRDATSVWVAQKIRILGCGCTHLLQLWGEGITVEHTAEDPNFVGACFVDSFQMRLVIGRGASVALDSS